MITTPTALDPALLDDATRVICADAARDAEGRAAAAALAKRARTLNGQSYTVPRYELARLLAFHGVSLPDT